MWKAVKSIAFLFITLSLTMVMIDCCYSFFTSSNHITYCSDCPDVSDHFESCHSHGHEDHVIISDSKSKTLPLTLNLDFVPISSVVFKNNYISIIWQPPKFS